MTKLRNLNGYSDLEYSMRNYVKLCYIGVCGLLVVISVVTALHFYIKHTSIHLPNVQNDTDYTESKLCKMFLVESIPIGLNYSNDFASHLGPSFLTTYDAWHLLINHTEQSLNIASYYWTMRGVDVINHTTAAKGEQIYEDIKALGLNDTIKIRIVQNIPTEVSSNLDTDLLQQLGVAEVRSVNFTRLLGDGILHTKLWISDSKHFYVGSANMDWRSLTQVKELGIIGLNCPRLGEDLSKIFEAYWFLGNDNITSIPHLWPSKYSTIYNFKNPLIVNNSNSEIVVSSAPPQLLAKGRVNDLESILNTIQQAQHFIYIAVMDYYPLIIYTKPERYWPVIDDALRKAAIDNKVTIRLLISWWRYSNETEDYFLNSLSALSKSLVGVNIEVRRFIVPITDDDQLKIPHSRVNHNKYMVTDNAAYIGTSNWSGDYFTKTAGIGLHIRDIDNRTRTIQQDLLSIFERDWNSPYAVKLEDHNSTMANVI